MKNVASAGKGSLKQAIAHIEAAQWNLIHGLGANITTPEYDITFSLIDLLDEIKKQAQARAAGENPCNGAFAGKTVTPSSA